jgi:hypothetical protein
MEQEFTDLFGLSAEYFLCEVVEDVLLRTSQHLDQV